MKAFIYFDVIEKVTFTYSSPLLNWVKARFPEVTLLDIDSFSDGSIWQNVYHLSSLSTSLIFFINTNKDVNIGKSATVFESLLKKRQSAATFILAAREEKFLQILARQYKVEFLILPDEEIQRKMIEKLLA